MSEAACEAVPAAAKANSADVLESTGTSASTNPVLTMKWWGEMKNQLLIIALAASKSWDPWTQQQHVPHIQPIHSVSDVLGRLQNPSSTKEG